MKTTIATKQGFSISLLISLFAFILVILVFHLSFKESLFFSLVLFLFSFAVIKIHFQTFISTHIKNIYNIIYEGKTTENKVKKLVEIEQEALNWQKEQQKGIYDLQMENTYRKEFIGNLSHELKTPLFSIQGYIETLIDGGIHDENINMSYLIKASKNIDRLSAIIKDVDTIAKIESDVLNLNFTNFNLYDLVNHSIESLELLADKNDVKVELKSDEKVFKVNADKEKIQTVMVNLIANSIKYGKEGGKTVVSLSMLLDRVLVEVSDNGMGIKKEQLPRIFERFYRVDSNRSREQGGSGLGLAIVKHIIEAHKQTITVKSELNVGTTFRFTLNLV